MHCTYFALLLEEINGNIVNINYFHTNYFISILCLNVMEILKFTTQKKCFETLVRIC